MNEYANITKFSTTNDDDDDDDEKWKNPEDNLH